MSEAVESTAVELAENGTPDLAPPSNLFRTDNPAVVLQRAQETANALMPVVREKNLTVQIQGREYLKVEAWATLGAMLGVTPVCTWTKPLDNGWEARVEARTLDGRVVGAAEAECLRAEKRWANADDYAVRSMAQTRATSKALASVLRFVATLAGFSGTPAEEMPRDNRTDGEATPPQKRAISVILNKHLEKDFQRQVVHAVGGNPLTKSGASLILDVLKTEGRPEQESVGVLIKESGVVAPSDIPPADEADLPPAEQAVGEAGPEVKF